MAKYDPLETHLGRHGGASVELGFNEIERILECSLPNSARRPQWWANEKAEDSRHVQCRAWRNAGYEAFLVPGADRVRFTRTAE